MDLPAITAPDPKAAAAAADRVAELGLPAGALGALAELGSWLAAAQGADPPRPPAVARVVLLAADHGIAEAGVSAHPPGSTGRRVAAVQGGTAPVAVAARQAGASLRVVDVGLDHEPGAAAGGPHHVARSSGRIDRLNALTPEQVLRAIAVGRALADDEVDAGADLLVPAGIGVGASTPAAVLIAALTGAEPVAVIGRGSGIDDAAWMRKAAAVRDALRRARPYLDDPIALLRTAGGADLAALAGFCLQAAARRTPVLLDGVVVVAAALVAEQLAPGAKAWWLLAQRGREPGLTLAASRLGLTPPADLGIGLGDGTGAVALLPLLTLAARLLADGGAPGTATTDTPTTDTAAPATNTTTTDTTTTEATTTEGTAELEPR